jgi:phosphate transport system protein
MERIGDQAADIAMLASSFYLDYDRDDAGTRSVRELLKHRIPIRDMAKAAATMLTMSMDSFVTANLDKAREAIKMDDVVDDLFRKVKQELLDMITHDHQNSGICLDVLMIAKYLERIGDHSVNIAERVVYSITGDRNDAV